jgi:hypothetical protein
LVLTRNAQFTFESAVEFNNHILDAKAKAAQVTEGAISPVEHLGSLISKYGVKSTQVDPNAIFYYTKPTGWNNKVTAIDVVKRALKPLNLDKNGESFGVQILQVGEFKGDELEVVNALDNDLEGMGYPDVIDTKKAAGVSFQEAFRGAIYD